MDGNMKIHRPVCGAKDAGCVEHDGLPGKVKTRCMNTTEQRSFFRANHKPRTDQTESSNAVVEFITGRRQLRNTCSYQVQIHACKCTERYLFVQVVWLGQQKAHGWKLTNCLKQL